MISIATALQSMAPVNYRRNAVALSLVPRSVAIELDALPIRVDSDDESGDTLVLGVRDARAAVADKQMHVRLLRAADVDRLAFVTMPAREIEDLVVESYGRPREKNPARQVELFESMLEDAVNHNASDLHFEPREVGGMAIRRVNRRLEEIGPISEEIYDTLVRHVKTRADMNSFNARSASDGQLEFVLPHRMVEVRVNSVPVGGGEREGLALRIFGNFGGIFPSYKRLGMTPAIERLWSRQWRRPQGLNIIAGPMNAGKSTTMRRGMIDSKGRGRRVSSAEDPIEQRVWGIDQIRVDPANHLDYHEILPVINRRDAEVVIVGETRNKPTAEAVFDVALGGRLAGTSIHAIDAIYCADKVVRLGVEPENLGAINAILAQRIVRQLCTECKLEDSTPFAVRKRFPEAPSRLMRAVGCLYCNNTGYRRAFGVFELMVTTPEIRRALMDRSNSEDLRDLARASGYVSMFEDGMRRVFAGDTTLTALTEDVDTDESLDLEELVVA